MSEFKNVMRNGWHPKGKDGGKESWRGDFKGINQVAGWVGKGKKADIDVAREHTSRPLATLKDPSAFGPPPKNVNYHGGAALPNEITPHRGGLGAPLTQEQIEAANSAVYEQEREESEERAKPPPPPLPYRADRTGLKTNHLPPPPIHRDIQSTTGTSPVLSSQPAATQARAPPPLPSRQNTLPSVAEPPPPAYTPTTATTSNFASLNSSAMNRLGKAGVSVPALGISSGGEANPWKNERSQSTNSQGSNQMSELQSRFARMTSSSSAQSNQEVSPSPTTQEQQNLPSWQQSQQAFQTAQNMHKNPSQVTMADAQAAAQTANQTRTSVNNFRDRHADSIANAQAKAKAWDQRYKVTSKINKFLDEHTEDEKQQQQQQQQQGQQQSPQVAGQQYTNQQYQQPGAISSQPQQEYNHPQTQTTPPTRPVPSPRQSSEMQASISRKPPPPPPPKKPANMQAPPPVPMGTKPR